MHRGPFREAMTWLEIHGDAPEVLEHWRGFIEAGENVRSPARTGVGQRIHGADAGAEAAAVPTPAHVTPNSQASAPKDSSLGVGVRSWELAFATRASVRIRA